MVISDGLPVDNSTLLVNPSSYLEQHLKVRHREHREPLAGGTQSPSASAMMSRTTIGVR